MVKTVSEREAVNKIRELEIRSDNLDVSTTVNCRNYPVKGINAMTISMSSRDIEWVKGWYNEMRKLLKGIPHDYYAKGRDRKDTLHTYTVRILYTKD